MNCIMSDDNPHLATEKCMDNLMINQPSYELVDFCHSTNPGENLLHNYGVETAQLNPQHYFIPWITFDNVSVLIKSVHFKKSVARSSLLSKLWYFSIQKQQVPHI